MDNWNVGDKALVVFDCQFSKGTIVTLKENDGSDRLLFSDGMYDFWVYLVHVDKITSAGIDIGYSETEFTKYKVGDRVTINRERGNATGASPFGINDNLPELYISSISPGGKRQVTIYDVNRVYIGIFKYSEVTLFADSSTQKNIIKPKKTFMTTIKTFVKNALLTPSEKLLRKHGLKDSCGDYTQDAIDVTIQKLVKDNEAELIKIAEGLEAEETKNK